MTTSKWAAIAEVEPEKKIKYVSYKNCKEGDVIVSGVFSKVKLKDNKFNPGTQQPEFWFKELDGTDVVLNTCKNIEKEMDKYSLGDSLEIVFLEGAQRTNKAKQSYTEYLFEFRPFEFKEV